MEELELYSENEDGPTIWIDLEQIVTVIYPLYKPHDVKCSEVTLRSGVKYVVVGDAMKQLFNH